MKRIIMLILVFLSMAGCNGGGSNSGQGSENPQPDNSGTTQQTDSEAPSVPSNPSVSAVYSSSSSSSAALVSWSASTDNRGVSGYRIYRNGAFLAESASLKYTDAGIYKTERYCYSVSAFDEAGNESGQSTAICFNASAGRIKWKFRTEYNILTETVAGSNGNVYVCDIKYLYSVNSDGTLKWKFPLGHGYQYEILVDATGNVYVRDVKYLYSVNSDGSLKWKFSIDNDGIEGLGNYGDSTRDINNRLFSGADNTVYILSDLYLSAVNPDGSVKWQSELPVSNYASGISVSSDGTVYFGVNNSFFALGPDGNIRWQTESPGAIPYVIDLLSDGTVYVQFASLLKAFSPEGVIKFSLDTSDSISVVKAGEDGTVYASKATCILRTRMTRPLNGKWSPPIYRYDAHVYSADGILKWTMNNLQLDRDMIGSGGSVYQVTGNGLDILSHHDGTIVSHYEGKFGSYFTEGISGNFYAITSDNDFTYLEALNSGMSGTWKTILGNKETSLSDRPLIAPDGTIYVQTYPENAVFAISSDSGRF